MKYILQSILFLVCSVCIHAQEYSRFTDFRLLRIYADSLIFPGSLVGIEYEIESTSMDWGEIGFENNGVGFEGPVLLSASPIGNRFLTPVDGERHLVLCQTFSYGYIPADTGRVVIPTAWIEVGGKRFEAEGTVIGDIIPVAPSAREIRMQQLIPAGGRYGRNLC